MQSLDRAFSLIRSIPDYPKPGIVFKDITPLLSNSQAFSTTIDAMNAYITDETIIVGVEARGFIFASAMATRADLGFVPIRKAGKLPFSTLERSYGLEYGDDVIQVHTDAFLGHRKVLLVDDVLATGGTITAAIDLIKSAGAAVNKVVVLLEITSLGGREKIQREHPDVEVIHLVKS